MILLKETQNYHPIGLKNYIQVKSKNYSLSNNAKINYTGGIRTNYWDFNNEFFISPRLIIGYKPDWKKDFVFSCINWII